MAQDYQVQVLRVIDGDSVRVRMDGEEHSVRMYGIDAPEKRQSGGATAHSYLEQIVRSERHWRLHVLDVDRYQRLVGLLYPEDGRPTVSANHEMVRSGWAYWYREYGGAEWGFDRVERQARDERAGLWQDEDAMRPWDYRRMKRGDARARRSREQSSGVQFIKLLIKVLNAFARLASASGGGGRRRRRRSSVSKLISASGGGRRRRRRKWY